MSGSAVRLRLVSLLLSFQSLTVRSPHLPDASFFSACSFHASVTAFSSEETGGEAQQTSSLLFLRGTAERGISRVLFASRAEVGLPALLCLGSGRNRRCLQTYKTCLKRRKGSEGEKKGGLVVLGFTDQRNLAGPGERKEREKERASFG